MKVLMFSISLEGGAGGATFRLHKSLQSIGVTSEILVQTKSLNIDDKAVIVGAKTKLVKGLGWLRQELNYLPLIFYPNRDLVDLFSPQWLPDAIPIVRTVAQLRPDVINLHWICGGYVRIETIAKLNKPLVWTLHDMWAFTGGCHQSSDCDRYTENCGACPQLHSSKNWDLSRWVWMRKARAWQNLDLTIVTPSSWLAKCARSSSLFRDLRIEVIPHGIDRHVARELLNLPQDKQIILFGAWLNNYNKGFHLLQQALQSLTKSGWRDEVEVVVFGFSQPSNRPDLGFKSHYLGRVSHDILPLVYSAANVFVAPTIRETFGLTIAESLSCGTPAVAFDATGPKDIIEHKRNGYLAKPYDVEDLAQGIKWVLEDNERHQRLAYHAREKIEQEFALELMARRYLALFNEIVD
jgi:glycosyltransferase involved in cell wall biosynthesis